MGMLNGGNCILCVMLASIHYVMYDTLQKNIRSALIKYSAQKVSPTRPADSGRVTGTARRVRQEGSRLARLLQRARAGAISYIVVVSGVGIADSFTIHLQFNWGWQQNSSWRW